MFYKIISSILSLLVGFAFSSVSYAKDFKGTSQYYIADLSTKNMALKFARDSAKQAALEQAGTFVTSLSESKKGLLTKDDIKVVTLGVAKLKPNSEHINYSAPDQNGIVTLSYSAIFDIDEKEVEKNIINYQINSKELKEATLKVENQQNFIKELGVLYQELQKKYANANNDKTTYSHSITNIREGLSASEYRKIADDYLINLDFKNALIYYKKELESYNRIGFSSTDNYTNNNKILAMHGIAMCYNGLHQNEQVETILEEALKLAKEDHFKAFLLTQLAKARMAKGERIDNVINLISKALSIYAGDEIYSERMGVYCTFGKWEKALEDYERLSEENKKALWNISIAAVCYAWTGDADKALQLDALRSKYDKKFESDYGLIYTNYKYIWSFARGKAYFERYGKNRNIEDIDKAIHNFTAFLNTAPVNDLYLVHAYFHRGVCYAEKKDYKSAYNDAMMVLTINPDYEPAKLMIKLIEEEQKNRY